MMGTYTNTLNTNLKKQHKAYERLMLQTFLTAPEWRNVEMAEELGKFMQRGNAFYQFPYFKQIGTFWRIFAKSYGAAKKHHSHYTLLTSEYMMMNAFIGLFTTVGFLGLGILSSCLFLVMKKRNESTFQTHVGKLVSDYATFIHKIPFYNFDYKGKIKPLYQAFSHCPNKSLTDYVTFLTAISQLLARSIVSWPIAWWYNQPQNQAADSIHLLVKSQYNKDMLEKIDQGIKVLDIHNNPNHHDTKVHYAHITVPRYEAFANVVDKLIKQDVAISKIACQDSIQCKVLADQKSMLTLNCDQVLYSYQNHLDENRFVMLNVKAKELKQTFNSLENNGIKLKLIHDF